MPRGGRRVLLARRDRSVASPWPPLRRTLLKLLDDHGAAGTLSVALVDDAEMRRLHRDFSGVDEATDVLSFPLARAGGVRDGVLGEVVVSAETALREAKRRGLAPAREVALYAIHGALHLVGFDDKDAARRRVMRRKERQYLAVWTADARGSGPAKAGGAGRGVRGAARAAAREAEGCPSAGTAEATTS